MYSLFSGTLKERGLLHLLKETDTNNKNPGQYVEGLEIYELPFIPDSFRRRKIARYIPVISHIKGN
uniref:Uncharacterized protein n=1 Tax=Arion vulgaris TaxID=1028688 RepID=A0A0B7BD92_9EUPU